MPSDIFDHWLEGGAPVLVTNATTGDTFDYWDGGALVLQLDLTLLSTTLALPLDDVTPALEGAAASTGTLAVTLDGLTPDLALHPEGAASLTLTLDDVTLLLTGVEAASGTLTLTLDGLTPALALAVGTTATLTLTLDDVTPHARLHVNLLRGTPAWYDAALHQLTVEGL